MKINVLKTSFFFSRSIMASTRLKGKLQVDLWKISLIAGWLWVEIICIWHYTLTGESSVDLPAATAPTSPLGWEQDQAHPSARWDLHHLRGTVPKLLLCPGQLCPELASVLLGFVSQSGKLSCSSEVSDASTPRSEQKPPRSLLQYFSCPVRGVLIDLFTSRHKARTYGPYVGIKRVLSMKRCAGVHHFSLGSPGLMQHLSCSCGTNP